MLLLAIVGKEHVSTSSSSLNALELREQLVGVGFPVAVEVVLNVADRYFLAWKAAMLQSSELTGDELLMLIDQFVFTNNGVEMTSPFDQLKLYNLIWKHLTQQRDVQVKLCTFDALYGFTDKDEERMKWLHQITSFAVSASSDVLMDCVANWMKLHPTEAIEVADRLYHDFCLLLPNAHEPLMMIAMASPHLAYRLSLAYITMFSMGDAHTLPPDILLQVMLKWFTDCPQLFTIGEGHTLKLRLLRSHPLNPETIPLVGLIRWSVIGPLIQCSNEGVYSDLHYKLLVAVSLCQTGKALWMSDQLILLAKLLMKHAGNRGDESVNRAVDRLAQMLQISITSQVISMRSSSE